MTVQALIKILKDLPPDANVSFDTEAARFHCHLANIYSVELIPKDVSGTDEIIFTTDARRTIYRDPQPKGLIEFGRTDCPCIQCSENK